MVGPMRIACSNPDAMGDLILRQSLYEALADSGHELLLLVRTEMLPVVRYVAPAAAIVEIPFDPYDSGPRLPHSGAMRTLARRVSDWQPEVLVFASWQWTAFDEWLSSELPGVPVIGFSGKCSSDTMGRSRQRFLRRVEAEIDLHEFEKNRRLAEAFDAGVPESRRPAIAPSEEALASARRVLNQVGLEAGNYWIASVGQKSSQVSRLRNWTLEGWARAISHGVQKHGWRFLLTATPDELDATRQIRELAGSPAAIVLQDFPIEIDTLVGLTALAQGYMGRDTGPMHLAAALDRPILALFGGGHWARFTPVARAAIVLTMAVPCARCEWRCTYADSYCIKEIPLDAVTAAMDDLARGMEGVEVRLLERRSPVVEAMEREAIASLKMVRSSQEELQDCVDELKTELDRSRRLNQHLLSSRWRKLGRALGIVKPAS